MDVKIIKNSGPRTAAAGNTTTAFHLWTRLTINKQNNIIHTSYITIILNETKRR